MRSLIFSSGGHYAAAVFLHQVGERFQVRAGRDDPHRRVSLCWEGAMRKFNRAMADWEAVYGDDGMEEKAEKRRKEIEALMVGAKTIRAVEGLRVRWSWADRRWEQTEMRAWK